MATPVSAVAAEGGLDHKRTKSSVLRSFMHKRTPSAGAALCSNTTTNIYSATANYDASGPMPILPSDHPHARALGELAQNQQSHTPPSPAKSQSSKSLHKKTLSSISLRSLAGKDDEKKEKPKKPKKTKSSRDLATLLGRPRSSKNLHKEAEEQARAGKDKENQTPPQSASDAGPPPIFAQFSSQHFATQALGGKFLESEIDLYTPQQYSPGKQRNFYEGPGCQPTLSRKQEPNARPRSIYLPSSFAVQDIGRRISNGSRRSVEIVRRVSMEKRPSIDRKATAPATKTEVVTAARGSRMSAAVAGIGAKVSKTKEAETKELLRDEDVDAEFEAMLDRRNIPEHQRHKMRSLAMSMKKDFIRQDWAETAAAREAAANSNSSSSRPGTRGSDDSGGSMSDNIMVQKRPRSKTFTLSKGKQDPNATTRKQKPEGTFGRHMRTKSSENVSSSAPKATSTGASVASILIAKAKGQTPEDFVAYLRKVQKPELVEVGKLHKLRLLLRNETVAWTDTFVTLGGMAEMVGLLHRIMEVEWREEHEDALLHEVLLCIKALCTTALALKHLNDIHHALFPALLAMLFSEDKKGPSEFTTRHIIIELLFTYLKSAPLPQRSPRAEALLSYLRDPIPVEEERPVEFVLEMRRERPYRVWCKEVVNVTKEVFWIFLHNLNVIALPSSSSDTVDDENIDSAALAAAMATTDHNTSTSDLVAQYGYMLTHFPSERPPVPAAPYVGGVEWDATNYLASHLDLVNGIIASLPTKEERNTLREQMRMSGWEKVMGATMRLCKEKFYGGVHCGLRGWVASGVADGWDIRDVRCGPKVESKSPVRKTLKKGEEAPRIEIPKLDFAPLDSEKKKDGGKVGDGWL